MIPPFNESGCLPEGIYDCTIDEATERFGAFQSSSQRPQLWDRFIEFMREADACELVDAVLVDGSFVTAKADPNDTDLVLVVSANHDFSADFNQASTTSFPSGGSIGGLDSTSWSLALTRRNTVGTWRSFNKSAWNRVKKRGY